MTESAKHTPETVLLSVDDDYECFVQISHFWDGSQIRIGERWADGSGHASWLNRDTFAAIVAYAIKHGFYGEHKSDCAVHNEPAFPNGECDCGLLKASGRAT